MSKSESATKRANEPEPDPPTSDDKVGYKRPPREYQFKPGNNANPRGRKKGSRNRKLVIEQILFEPITVREGGDVKKMPVLEAIIKKTAAKALAGDNKAALTVIGMAQKEGLLTPEQEVALEENLPETDKKILEDVKRRLGAARSAPAADAPAQPGGATADEKSQTEAPKPQRPKLTRPVP